MKRARSYKPQKKKVLLWGRKQGNIFKKKKRQRGGFGALEEFRIKSSLKEGIYTPGRRTLKRGITSAQLLGKVKNPEIEEKPNIVVKGVTAASWVIDSIYFFVNHLLACLFGQGEKGYRLKAYFVQKAYFFIDKANDFSNRF